MTNTRENEATGLPRTTPLRPILAAAGTPLNQPERPKAPAPVTVEDEAVDLAKKLIKERGQRRADAMWAVWRAKEHDGRGDQPPSNYDADVVWNIADMLHAIAGAAPKPVVPEAAQHSAETARSLDSRVEEGIAAGTGEGAQAVTAGPAGENRTET